MFGRQVRKALAAGAMLVAATTAAFAAGFFTNGLVGMGAGTVNGTAQVAPAGVVGQLNSTGNYFAGTVPGVPVDTGLAGGVAPQSVSATPFQIAAVLVESSQNTATSTAGAATQNLVGGTVTTEALTTAVGATYTFTLTNSLIGATAIPQVAIYSKSNTGKANMVLTSATSASGSVVWVWTNNGTAALNGTMMIVWHL